MNNVPPSCKAKTFCCIPQWLINHTLKIPSGTQYQGTRNTLITIINPASSPRGWRAGLAPCKKREDYPDPFGLVVKGFLFTFVGTKSQKGQGCTGSVRPLARSWVLLLQVTCKKNGTEWGITHTEDASAPVSSVFLLVTLSLLFNLPKLVLLLIANFWAIIPPSGLRHLFPLRVRKSLQCFC